MTENELVKVINGKTVVSSRDVAENFGKRHDKLTYEIERMYGGLPEIVDTLCSKRQPM